MRILVIGAKGFIGQHLTRALEADGHDMTTVGKGDILPNVFFDAVIDCNGDARRFWAGENPKDSFDVTVAATAQRVLALKTKVYVYLSTVDIYGTGRSAQATSREDAPIDIKGLDTYGFHKLMAERLVAFHAPSHVILRLGTVIGPGLKKNPVYDATHGLPIRQTRDSTLTLIDLETIAKAVRALLAKEARGIYNLTGRASLGVGEMIETVARHQGCSVGDFVFHPDLLHTDYDVNVEAIERFLSLPSSLAMLETYLEGLRA
ncbi:MAG: NAD(P)-dependent oxidoreductase [Alphaproteobacteria bacterium]|nr:NAD(P)-dependent oxidoreductase [Alphaproteobacteria bacterium]